MQKKGNHTNILYFYNYKSTLFNMITQTLNYEIKPNVSQNLFMTCKRTQPTYNKSKKNFVVTVHRIRNHSSPTLSRKSFHRLSFVY